MSDFNIQIKGLDELVNSANKIGGEMPALLYKVMVDSTTDVMNDAKRIGPGSFKNQTGTLRRSIDRRVISSTKGLVFVGEKYGTYVEEGTGPHIIRPKNKKMLAFKINGKMVFARQVRHPGSRPYPFMKPSFEENKPKILARYAQMGDYIVKQLAK
jgi:HK97 gp10 family phage protein